jgi:hypothetical protein
MSNQRDSAVALALAKKLVRVIGEMYPERDQRIDWEQLLSLVATPSPRQALSVTMHPWMVAMYGVNSLPYWIAVERANAGMIIELLQRFVNYTMMVNAMIIIMRDAAAAIRTYGWLQGNIGNSAEGFCILGAISYVHQDGNIIHRCAVLDALRNKVQTYLGRPETIPLSVWNDAPGRTANDVLMLLDGCALELETV